MWTSSYQQAQALWGCNQPMQITTQLQICFQPKDHHLITNSPSMSCYTCRVSCNDAKLLLDQWPRDTIEVTHWTNSNKLQIVQSSCLCILSWISTCCLWYSNCLCAACFFFHSEIVSSGTAVDSVHQAEPPNTSCAPIPQGATSLLWLCHGLKNHGLKPHVSGLQREMPSRRSWQAGPSPSPPCRTSTSCQPWLLASGESWSCTALEEWTCQTSSPPLCQSLPDCSRPWRCQLFWSPWRQPTNRWGLPWSWPSDPSWLSWQPSLPSSPSLQGPWCWNGREVSESTAWAQINFGAENVNIQPPASSSTLRMQPANANHNPTANLFSTKGSPFDHQFS